MERQRLGILGLLPAAVRTDEEEIARCKANLDRLTDDLDKYIYLAHLQVKYSFCGNIGRFICWVLGYVRCNLNFGNE